MTDRDRGLGIHKANAEGPGQTRLTEDPTHGLVPDWSPLDTTAPAIVSNVTPAAGATGVSARANATFSEAMDKATLTRGPPSGWSRRAPPSPRPPP